MKSAGLGILLLLFVYSNAVGQSIISIIPSNGYPGQELDIVIRGFGTGFSQGNSIIDLGVGITVIKTAVSNKETISAKIKIDETASSGNRDVSVVTGSEIATLPGGFQVFEAGQKVSAILDIIPVQTLRLSDFDLSNVSNTPLLFIVTVFNDQQPHNLKAYITVSGSKEILATGVKDLKLVPSNGIVKFDNRQIDKYEMGSGGSQIIQNAFKTGVLPADVYTYYIEIREGSKVLATAEGKNVLFTQVSKPELISPGNNFNSPPQNISAIQPVFQWFSQASYYTVNIYTVNSSNTTPEEVILNKPLHSSTRVTQTNLLYPSSAKGLKEGQTYAWQVIAHYEGGGSNDLPSEVFWFKIRSSSTPDPSSVNEIKVEPNELYIPVNGNAKFIVKAYNVNNEEVMITPVWRVVPSNAGIIDQKTGIFTAGSKAQSVAIVAIYGELQDYATINLVVAPPDKEISKGFIQKLFGLPTPK